MRRDAATRVTDDCRCSQHHKKLLSGPVYPLKAIDWTLEPEIDISSEEDASWANQFTWGVNVCRLKTCGVVPEKNVQNEGEPKHTALDLVPHMLYNVQAIIRRNAALGNFEKYLKSRGAQFNCVQKSKQNEGRRYPSDLLCAILERVSFGSSSQAGVLARQKRQLTKQWFWTVCRVSMNTRKLGGKAKCKIKR